MARCVPEIGVQTLRHINVKLTKKDPGYCHCCIKCYVPDVVISDIVILRPVGLVLTLSLSKLCQTEISEMILDLKQNLELDKRTLGVCSRSVEFEALSK